ncbi:MAG: TIGR01212 family radical SAM protein [Ruminococcaceae bacterium]|nr:TIGR01212 family radical SAM protein [Oscillospiraceae bacterium]
MSQAENNPFKYSDTNKRYHTYDYYLKHRFGEKCAKITLDCGFTCPNIDGKCGVGGCIYCSGGSGARLADNLLPIEEQYRQGVNKIRKKWNVKKLIPYLQAYTNTYTSPEILGKILGKVSQFEGAVMIDIATRADCLGDDIIEVLDRVSSKIPVTVELGLQSSNDETARLINRGHDFDTFKDGFYRLRKGAPNVKIGIHIINGLPGETNENMKNTATRVADLHPDLIKIHLLHVLDGTVLGQMYKKGEYTPMEREEYILTVCDQIELLPPDIIIERVTGDGLAEELLAPEWSKKKVTVINDIDKELFRRGSYQGIRREV